MLSSSVFCTQLINLLQALLPACKPTWLAWMVLTLMLIYMEVPFAADSRLPSAY
jgi:hypothetical protein